MSIHVFHSGANRTMKAGYVFASGANRPIKEIWIYRSGANRLVYSSSNGPSSDDVTLSRGSTLRGVRGSQVGDVPPSLDDG